MTPSTPSSNGSPSNLTDPAEKAAFELVPACLGAGAWAEPYDHSGRRAAVDFLLHFPDRRMAAMEVTSAAAPRVRQLYSLLGRHETLPNPGDWTWSATIDDPRDLPDLLARASPIILVCESAGVPDPRYAYHLRADQNIRWLMGSSVEMHGSPSLPKMDGDRERPMFLTQGGRGGSVDESLSGFAPEIQKIIDEPHVQKRVAKLGKSGLDEQHLFLLVDQTALKFSVFYALMARDAVPRVAPHLPGDVTHLWLLITFTPWLILITADGITRFRRPGGSSSETFAEPECEPIESPEQA